ncbi:CARDB domain-containing protein [Haloglomus litoreum]|uniref:CARDB domain-containing protein n=1 Tax=Haloglomus litoreum TaxID=3034026 RepID=UPI0023E77F8E|nr:CARDB domain-containing protein [Haloglomus sp. DT116]
MTGTWWSRAGAVALALLVVTAMGAAVASTTDAPASRTGAPAHGSVDVVFVVDSSANAEPLGEALEEELPGVATAMEERGLDPRFGLVTYESDATVVTGLSDDVGAVESGLAGVEYSGSFENASEGVMAASGLSYRSGAERFYVVLTNEDDSSSTADRATADEALSGRYATLFAAGPRPWERRADAVGGTWYGVPAAFQSGSADVAGAMDQLVDTAETTAERRVQRVQAPSPDIEITDATITPEKTVVGSPVEIAVTVTNEGDGDGTFRPQLRSDGRMVGGNADRRSIPAGESRTYRFTHTFDERGSYVLSLDHDYVGQVRVADPGPVTTAVTRTELGISAHVRNASVAHPVTVDLPSDSVADTTGVAFEQLGIRAAEYGDLSLRLSQSARPDELAASDGVRSLSTVIVDSDPSAATGNLSVQFSINRTMYPDLRGSSVFVARPGGSDGPARIEAERVNTTATRYVYRFETADEFPAVYTVATGTPAVSVERAALSRDYIRTGEVTTVTATVRNDGSGGTLSAVPLRLDGDLAGVRLVPIGAGETRTVTFTVFLDSPGRYNVSVGDAAAGDLMVGAEFLPEHQDEPTGPGADGDGPTGTTRAQSR